jgi:hypothetical protein
MRIILDVITMNMQWTKKIHVVHPGSEINRVVEPTIKIGGDQMYIFAQKNGSNFFTDIRDEIIKRIKKKCPQMKIDVIEVNLFSMEDCMCSLTSLISSEVKKGNIIFANISTGSKPFITALMVAAQMFGGRIYYSKALEYAPKNKKRVNSKGRLQDTKVEKVGDPEIIPDFRLEKPDAKLIMALKIINGSSCPIKQKELILEIAKSNYLTGPFFEIPYEKHDIRDAPREAQLTKAIYNKFRTQILEKLKEKKWIEIISRGRGAKIKLTDNGKLWLKMFENAILD